MKLGFTGTRDGMTDEQRLAFIAWAKAAGVKEIHHGCCLGADVDAVDVFLSAADLGFTRPLIVAHQPAKRAMLSEEALWSSDVMKPPLDYLERNRNIVDSCDILLACPKGPEELRSGTWATVRYARKRGKRLLIFWPCGSVTDESVKHGTVCTWE